MSEFREKVLQIVRDIPRGQVMSYGEVAKQAGSAGAARAVGSIMKSNYDDSVPCHRVIHADGTPGYYNRGDAHKVVILRDEGVDI